MTDPNHPDEQSDGVDDDPALQRFTSRWSPETDDTEDDDAPEADGPEDNAPGEQTTGPGQGPRAHSPDEALEATSPEAGGAGERADSPARGVPEKDELDVAEDEPAADAPAEDSRAASRAAEGVDQIKGQIGERWRNAGWRKRTQYVGGAALALLLLYSLASDFLAGGDDGPQAPQAENNATEQSASQGATDSSGDDDGATSAGDTPDTPEASTSATASGGSEGDAYSELGKPLDGGGSSSKGQVAGAGDEGPAEAAAQQQITALREDMKERLATFGAQIKQAKGRAEEAIRATEQLNQVHAQIEELSNAIDQLHNQVDALRSAQSTLTSRVDELAVERSSERVDLQLAGFTHPQCTGCVSQAIVYLGQEKRLVADGDSIRDFTAQLKGDRLVLTHDKTGKQYSYVAGY